MEVMKLFEELKEMRWVDLSHEFGEFPVRAYQYSCPGQYGTNVDTLGHAMPGGRTLEQIELKECVMPLCVIDCTRKVEENTDYALAIEDIEEYETKYGKIPKGSFVAMRSDWGKRWPNQKSFQNKDENGRDHYPGWSLEAAKFLVEKREIGSIGHETFDTDPVFQLDVLLFAQKSEMHAGQSDE